MSVELIAVIYILQTILGAIAWRRVLGKEEPISSIIFISACVIHNLLFFAVFIVDNVRIFVNLIKRGKTIKTEKDENKTA